MRTRLILAATALGALALAAPAAFAAPAPATLDGKKVKSLSLSVTTTAQSNDKDLALASTEERMQCVAPRCAVLPFVFKPAKGVKGDTLFTIKWANAVSDMDLFIVSVNKGVRTRIASCGGSVGTSEKVFLPAGTMKAGKTYALIADFYRTPGEKVTGTVEMPGKDTVAKTVPANADTFALVNCTL